MRIGLRELIYCTVLIFVIMMVDKLVMLIDVISGIKAGSTPEEKAWGMLGFGMWAVTIMALIVLAQRSGGNNENDKNKES